MIHFAFRPKPGVATASPVAQRPISRQAACSRSHPAARWIAPSTPPPPARCSLAALTTASTSCRAMSPLTASILTAVTLPEVGGRHLGGEDAARGTGLEECAGRVAADLEPAARHLDLHA